MLVGGVGHGDVIADVQLLADDAAAQGVGVQAHHEVQHRGPVTALDDAGIFAGGQQFLGQIEAAVVPLLKGKAGIGRQVLKGDGAALGQGMLAPQVHIGGTVDQVGEGQARGAHQLFQGAAVEVVEVQDADLAAGGGHVLQHRLGAGLADGKVVFAHVEAAGHLHKGLDRKGIMLGGHGKLLPPSPLLAVYVHQVHVLAVHLPGIGQKARALRRQRHPALGAVENGDADLLFQFLNGAGQGGLGHVQALRRLVQRSRFRYLDHVVQLLQGHGRASR